MKHKILFTIFTALIALLLVACGGRVEPTPPPDPTPTPPPCVFEQTLQIGYHSDGDFVTLIEKSITTTMVWDNSFRIPHKEERELLEDWYWEHRGKVHQNFRATGLSTSMIRGNDRPIDWAYRCPEERRMQVDVGLSANDGVVNYRHEGIAVKFSSDTLESIILDTYTPTPLPTAQTVSPEKMATLMTDPKLAGWYKIEPQRQAEAISALSLVTQPVEFFVTMDQSGNLWGALISSPNYTNN